MNPKQNLDLSKSTEVVCSKYGSPYFTEVLKIRKLSKFITGESKDSIFPIPVLRCVDCGNVNDEFNAKI